MEIINLNEGYSGIGINNADQVGTNPTQPASPASTPPAQPPSPAATPAQPANAPPQPATPAPAKTTPPTTTAAQPAPQPAAPQAATPPAPKPAAAQLPTDNAEDELETALTKVEVERVKTIKITEGSYIRIYMKKGQYQPSPPAPLTQAPAVPAQPK